jgi:hypothetical protein
MRCATLRMAHGSSPEITPKPLAADFVMIWLRTGTGGLASHAASSTSLKKSMLCVNTMTCRPLQASVTNRAATFRMRK